MTTAGFAQISYFDCLNGYASGADTRLAFGRAEMLRAARLESASNLVFTGDYLDRTVDASQDSIERSGHGQNGRLGYNWQMNDWSFGAAVGYGDVRSNYKEINSPSPTPLRGNVDAKSTMGYVWASYSFSGWRLAAVGNIGATKNTARRTSDAGTSLADFDSSDRAFGLSLSHEYSFSDAMLVTPFVGLSFASSSADGFTEQGTAPDRRIVRDFSMDENRGAIGVRLSGKGATWQPFASAAWLARFSGGNSDIFTTALNGANLSVGRVTAASKGLFYVSTGLSGKLDEHWNCAGTIEYYSGGNERALGLALSVVRKF